MRRHSPDSIAGSVLLMGCGAALLILSRRWGVGSDLPSQMAAFVGPVGIVLGFGMAIHGKAMPLNRITTLTRLWGLGGSVAAFANLWMLGYFSQGGRAVRATKWVVPVVLVVAWLLPARFYGDEDPRAGQTTAPGRRVP